MSEHLDVTALLERGEVDDLFDRAADDASLRVRLLEQNAYPAGCTEPALGYQVLTLLDRLAAGVEKDPALLAHVDACPSCAAEAKDATEAAEAAAALAERLKPEAEKAPAPEVGLSCVFCHDRLQKEHTVYCAKCLAPHHGECFTQHGRCSVFGCEETEVVRRQQAAPATPSPWTLRVLALVVAGGVSTVAAWQLTAVRSVSTPASPAPSPTTAAAKPSVDPEVLARVGREQIFRSDLDTACAVAGVTRFAGRMQELSKLVEQSALVQEAHRRKIALGDDELRTAAAMADFQYVSRLSSRAERVRRTTLLERSVRKLLVEKLLEQEAGAPRVTDAQVQAYFRLHADRFRSTGETRIREILLMPSAADGVRVPAAIQRRIGADGTWRTSTFRSEAPITAENFEAAQRRYSMGSTEEQVLPASDVRELLLPKLAQAINRLRPGEIARVTCYTGSTHIVKLIARSAPGRRTLGQSRHLIRAQLQREADAEYRRAFIEGVLGRTKIETFLGRQR